MHSELLLFLLGINKLIHLRTFLNVFFNKAFLTLFLESLKKALLNLLQYCFSFMFWFIGLEAHGILAPPPGIELTPPVLEDEVLTTGSPGKSPSEGFNC